MEFEFKTIIEQMTITDVITLLTALGTVLGLWIRVSSIITKLKTITDQQDVEIKQLKEDLRKHKETNDIKIEKLSDKLDHVGSIIGDKLSAIDRDLIETTVFLKNNVNFLSSISKDNKLRIDEHDKRFLDYDKSITEFYKNTK